MDAEPAPRRGVTPQLVMGALILAVGLLFTFDNLGLIDARPYLRYWPAALIAVGALKLWQARGGDTVVALVLMFAGTWLLLKKLGLVAIGLGALWPLVLVLFGATLVWRGIRGSPRRASADITATINAVAMLGGIHRGSNSRAFRGGSLTVVMGGCELDLRQAAIDGDAVLDVFAMWGGIEIQVPEDWSVSGRVTPILGGYEDKTRPPRGATAHRLVVRGFAIMGGIDIKN